MPHDGLFDPKAAAEADDRFYAEYPEYVGIDGQRTPLTHIFQQRPELSNAWSRHYDQALDEMNGDDDSLWDFEPAPERPRSVANETADRSDVDSTAGVLDDPDNLLAVPPANADAPRPGTGDEDETSTVFSEDTVRSDVMAAAPAVVQADDRSRTSTARQNLERHDSFDENFKIGDQIDPINPINSCPENTVALVCTPIADVDLVQLRFTKDHGVLRDETAAWTTTGTVLTEPDWTPDMAPPNAVSVSMSDEESALNVEITYKVEDDHACPSDGKIRGKFLGGRAYYKDATFRPKAELKLALEPAFEDEDIGLPLNKIQEIDFNVTWEAGAEGRKFNMGESKNKVFMTFGPAKDGEHQEDGPTLKRMSKAVYLTQGTPRGNKTQAEYEFEIIKDLFNCFDTYTLGIEYLSAEKQAQLRADNETYDMMKAAKWPTYFNADKGGAWPMADFDFEWGAECQAICRFIRGVMRQLGAESTLEFRTYCADFGEPEKVLNQGTPTGPKKHRKHKNVRYSMVDSADFRHGETIWHPIDEGEQMKVGFNNFEAYLKVTPPDGGRPRLFGGGVGLIDEQSSPLHVFKAIVAYVPVKRKVKNKAGKKVTQFGKKIIDSHIYFTGAFDYDHNLP
jgi:hypothetical protein